MAKEKKKIWFILGAGIFVVYIFAAARPVAEEIILKPRWISSLESGYPVVMGELDAESGGEPLPFLAGNRYGYLEDDGNFLMNKTREKNVSVSEKYWAEYGERPSSVAVMNPQGGTVLTVEDAGGYPLFLDNRVFIVGSEQNSVSAVGQRGEKLWTYDFPVPVTCVDAAAGAFLAGTLDGAVFLLNASGVPVFTPFEPGGSRLSVILGCAISRDASRIALVSGIDEQRFLFLELSGDNYKVVYHEFLGTGFRRPVHISFADNDSKVAFEREGGLGIYDIASRSCAAAALTGEVTVLDGSGEPGFLFAVTSRGANEKRFIAIRYPASVVTDVPFKSAGAFFTRRGGKIYLGGDRSIVSFSLESK